jgi:hypothetical protein
MPSGKLPKTLACILFSMNKNMVTWIFIDNHYIFNYILITLTFGRNCTVWLFIYFYITFFNISIELKFNMIVSLRPYSWIKYLELFKHSFVVDLY